MKADNPDVIYAIGYYFVGGPLLAQLRAGGLKQPIVGAQAFDSMKLMEIAKDAAEGVYVVGGMDRGRTVPADFQAFLAEFKKRAGYDAEAVAANCFSSVMLVADAIKRAGSTDPAKIREALGCDQELPDAHRAARLLQFGRRALLAARGDRGEERSVRGRRRHRRPGDPGAAEIVAIFPP